MALAGEAFALVADALTKAIEQVKLRNQQLAHRGASATDLQPQIQPWGGDHRAGRVAQRFVAAYLERFERATASAPIA